MKKGGGVKRKTGGVAKRMGGGAMKKKGYARGGVRRK